MSSTASVFPSAPVGRENWGQPAPSGESGAASSAAAILPIATAIPAPPAVPAAPVTGAAPATGGASATGAATATGAASAWREEAGRFFAEHPESRLGRAWLPHLHPDTEQRGWRCAEPAAALLTGVMRGHLQALMASLGWPEQPLQPPAPTFAFDRPRPDSRFETFLNGPSSLLALAACRGMAERADAFPSPLFISGGVGLGKTHLVHALANTLAAAFATGEGAAIHLFSGESWAEAVRRHASDGARELFTASAITADWLMVDDVAALDGNEDAQALLAYVLDERLQAGRPAVFTAAQAPRLLTGLSDKLRSRCQWGLAVELEPLTPVARRDLLSRRAAALRLALDDTTLDYLASTPLANVREIDGALHRLRGLSSLEDAPVDASLARRALGEAAPVSAAPRPVHLGEVEAFVLDKYRMSAADLHSERRSRAVALPRQVAMYLMHRHTPASMEVIGRYFGGRDHSTVKHACEKIRHLLTTDPVIQGLVEEFQQKSGTPEPA